MPQLIPVTTTRLGEHLPLLELLPDAKPFSWVRGGDGMVGWGVFAQTTVKGTDRFAQARNWWHQQLEKFAVTDSVHITGTGPILFTSFSYSEEDESVLIIPQVVVGMKGGKSWITWIGEQAQPPLRQTPEVLSAPAYTWSNGAISTDQWKENISIAV